LADRDTGQTKLLSPKIRGFSFMISWFSAQRACQGQKQNNYQCRIIILSITTNAYVI
jgi:hypothetical protein